MERIAGKNKNFDNDESFYEDGSDRRNRSTWKNDKKNKLKEIDKGRNDKMKRQNEFFKRPEMDDKTASDLNLDTILNKETNMKTSSDRIAEEVDAILGFANSLEQEERGAIQQGNPVDIEQAADNQNAKANANWPMDGQRMASELIKVAKILSALDMNGNCPPSDPNCNDPKKNNGEPMADDSSVEKWYQELFGDKDSIHAPTNSPNVPDKDDDKAMPPADDKTPADDAAKGPVEKDDNDGDKDDADKTPDTDDDDNDDKKACMASDATLDKAEKLLTLSKKIASMPEELTEEQKYRVAKYLKDLAVE